DHIDLYFQHRIDPAVAPEEVAEGMADLIREGKITHWGISEANEDYLRRAHKVCPVTAVQNRYSMMARQYESLFPTLEELGIGFVAFSPMANGFLTGQYGKGTAFAPRYDYRSSMPQFTDQAVDLALEVIAEAVCYALAQPENVDVSDLVVRPSRERCPPGPGVRGDGRKPCLQSVICLSPWMGRSTGTFLPPQSRPCPGGLRGPSGGLPLPGHSL